MQDIIIDEQVLMMWRNHTQEVLDMLIYIVKIFSEEACDATLERRNESFIALIYIILAILIIIFLSSFV